MDNNERPAGEMPVTPLLDELVERWWNDHFPGSAVARDTEAWNEAHAAKEALKRLLARHQDTFGKGSE